MNYFEDAFTNAINPSRKGATSELAACIWLLSKGYDVFRNICPSGSIDIIATKGSEKIFIDVKSAYVHVKTKKLSVYKKFQNTANDNGIRILYVFQNGDCKFDSELEMENDKTTSISS